MHPIPSAIRTRLRECSSLLSYVGYASAPVSDQILILRSIMELATPAASVLFEKPVAASTIARACTLPWLRNLLLDQQRDSAPNHTAGTDLLDAKPSTFCRGQKKFLEDEEESPQPGSPQEIDGRPAYDGEFG